jgi:formate hydrogenlyase transcriptional activator
MAAVGQDVPPFQGTESARRVLDTIPALAWSARGDGSADFFNQRWLDFTGLSRELAKDWGWTSALHPDDLAGLLDYWRSVLASGKPGEIEGRLRHHDGGYRWFLFRAAPLCDENGQVIRWYGTNTDIEDLKRVESLLGAEKHALEMIADGASLSDILDHLCNSMDLHVAPSMTTILLMDPDGKRLWHTAGSRVPREWIPVISPLPVALEAGLCGTAAFLKERIIVPDVATDPNWPDRLRPIAIRNGIRAGWSEPILTKERQVLGTFALYAPESRVPSDADLALIKGAGRIALIAIERQRSQEALRNALEEIQESERALRRMIETIPGFVCTLSAAGEVEVLNRQTLEYFGKTVDQLKNWTTSDAVHPDDLPRVIQAWSHAVKTGEPYVMELRQRRADGVYRWFQSRALPTRDEKGRITGWYMLLTDIDDRKRAECLLDGQNHVLEMTAKGDPLDSILETLCRVVEQTVSGCCCSVMLVDPSGTKMQQIVAPNIPPSYNDRFVGKPVDREGSPCTKAAHRRIQVLVPDIVSDEQWDVYGWRAIALDHGLRACWSTPIAASDGRVLGTFGIYWREPSTPTAGHQRIIEQITHLAAVVIERKRAEDALRESEQNLRLMIDGIPGFVFTATAEGEIEFVNQRILEYTGRTLEELKRWQVTDLVHPDDLPKLIEELRRSIETGQSQSVEHRVRGADGTYRWFDVRRLPARNEVGRIVRWYLLLTDIHDRKRAEEALRSREQELRLMVDSIPGFIATMTAAGELEVANRQTLEYFGKTIEELKNWATSDAIHPEDLQVVIDAVETGIAGGQPFEWETRAHRADGAYRWHHSRCHPQRDEAGNLVRWYILVTDIDERKRAETTLEKAYEEIRRLTDRLRDENVVLRQQIDQDFMFEDIVGSSPALKNALTGLVQVAPTDSTVLISGETGTGKELIAHAIHKRSHRASGAFVSVNCASIPPSLIASELFGHEKGAFTGAVQRRQGRFELAHGGTIFLDEIGDLPAETQLALLRVLQERTFERVGGNRVIPTDVRIIAATNRDLTAAIDSGAFRTDLFYRLNVFPIHVPPLRERKEDIPILIEYFVRRYADKAGKRISKIDKNTLELCESYDWPGNIRELQNIVERSVILCNEDTFRVARAWLTTQGATPRLERGGLTKSLEDYERGIIEAALAQSNGKVAGLDGAAAKLGIPRSTLDARIKQLHIKRHTVR